MYGKWYAASVRSVVAQVTYDPSQTKGNRDGGFSILANYIGVIGQPQNTKPEKIAMIAPVVMKSASSGQSDQKKLVTMQFVLPSKYTKFEEAPKPINEKVVIKEGGWRIHGVISFSGVATEAVVEEKVEKLMKSLEKDGYKVIGEYFIARYTLGIASFED
ncbi:hypothetical protein IFM89_038015 [Coptis chinensis]|uniref:SOUL heme-binding protein n=1 Tax=Coptis chinensis TaxID=261450 RepID=A0A835LT22_9MAGN|nr:hypothetical protein IFM89_038015 [Coptis chinensis]